MGKFIIDTNVLLAANKMSGQLEESDKDVCIDFLINSKENKSIIYIDSKGLFFKEYFKKNSRSGQPGVGDQFAKWLYDNQNNRKVCKIIIITPLDKNGNSFEEFIVPKELDKFDSSDRKFVAVSLACKNEPEICNASDSDWWIYKKDLKKIGLKIKFICPGQVQKWKKRYC